MAHAVGGYQPIEDINDPYVQEIGKFAVEEHNKQAGGQGLVFVRVAGGEQQVVAGTNYRLVVVAADQVDDGAMNKYEAVVYDKPWENFRDLSSFNLVPEQVVNQAKKVVIGEYQPIPNIEAPHVQDIAEFAVAEYDKQSRKALVFVRVVSGEQQVVAGTNYKLVVEAEDAGVTKKYEAVVYDKPWEKVRALTSFEPLPEQQIDRPVKRAGWYRYMCSCGKI